MKRIIIALATVAMATYAQAVQVRWGSGAIYSPDATGSTGAKWNGSKWTYTQSLVSTKGSISAIVWESATALSANAGDLYRAYTEGTTASLFSGATTYTGNNGSNAAAVSINGGSSYSAKDTVYAAVLYVLTDSDKTWYMENYASVTMGASTTIQNYLANFSGGGTGTATSTPMSWSPVPEPTSGLLMLLGFAGLALRRRRM